MEESGHRVGELEERVECSKDTDGFSGPGLARLGARDLDRVTLSLHRRHPTTDAVAMTTRPYRSVST